MSMEYEIKKIVRDDYVQCDKCGESWDIGTPGFKLAKEHLENLRGCIRCCLARRMREKCRVCFM